MSHTIMTIEEVAEYLRVSDRTVYDWAQKGDLPGGKLGTTWRFKRSDIEEWVNAQLKASPKVASPKSEVASPASPPPAVSSAISGLLVEMLSPERVIFLDGTEKENALRTLCAALATSPLISDEAELSTAIFHREELMSTGIGFGVGVPHVRLSSVNDLVMALGIAREPLGDYVSLDDVPVQIVCMVAANGSQHPQYIRALSAISSRLKEERVRQALIAATDEGVAFNLFTGGEG